MDIVLSQNGREVVFPVLPESYSIKSAQGNTTVNINAIGEVNLLGHANLDEVSFSSFFPTEEESYTEGPLMDPMEYVTAIQEMMGEPCELHLLDVTAMHCTVEEFSFSEDDGTGDIKFTITLKRYVYIDAKGIVDKKVSKVGKTAKAPKDGNIYIVKNGDNLFSIARKQMGTTNWKELYQTNKKTIGDNPNRITPGMKLTLPG